MFIQAPLDSFKSTLFCDGWEAEKFGCSRILNSRSYLELLSDGAEPAELSLLALDDESDLQIDVELPDEILALSIQVFQAVEDAEPDIPSGIVQQLVTTEEMEAKIMHAPCPAHISSEVEMKLYIDLYSKQALLNGRFRKVNFTNLTTSWNRKILELLKAADDVPQFFKSYRFKTEFQIVAFKELMEKKLIAREKLRPFYNEIRKFQDDLRSDNVIQQLPIVLPALLQPEPPLPEIPVPAPEPVPPVVEKQLPAPETKLNALRHELGHLLFDSIRNNDIEVCAKCRQPRKINRVFQTEHTQQTCPMGRITEEDKNRLATITRAAKQ